MAISLLASGLIDGIYAFDLASVGLHAMHSITLPGFVDLSFLNLGPFHEAVVHGHGTTIADASSTQWAILAQYFETDVFADTRAWWNDFISSGKIWTLIFGIVLGYVLRALTSYG
ncbi:MAG: hypothetical protein WBA10_00895 [Elainellaceae cyanobacterium]